MEQEIIFGIYSAMVIIVSSLATVAVQFMRRDKTESEADVNTAQSEKLRSDAMDTMYTTVARSAADSQELLKTLKEYLVELGQVQREVWALQGENQRSAEREKILTAQVETLMKSNLEKDAKIATMQEKISTLETERVSLLETVDELSKRLEASEASGDNGQDDDLAVKTGAIVVKKEVQETDAAPTETK